MPHRRAPASDRKGGDVPRRVLRPGRSGHLPPPAEPIPIVVGGRSDAAVRRAGRLGDGWLGIWTSSRRFAAAVELAADEAARAGRPGPPGRHAMQVWCGLADTKEAARACLAPAMEAFYQLPFERFERYCPYGTPNDVAEFLTRYAGAGCREFNLIPQAPDHDNAIAGTASVKKPWSEHDRHAASRRVPAARNEGSALMEDSAIFETHSVQGRFNAWSSPHSTVTSTGSSGCRSARSSPSCRRSLLR